MILIGIVAFFHVKQPDFENNKWVLSLTQKSNKKITKKRFSEKRYNFETNEDFLFKIRYHNLKPVYTKCWNFKFVSSELTEKLTVKDRYDQVGQACSSLMSTMW